MNCPQQLPVSLLLTKGVYHNEIPVLGDLVKDLSKAGCMQCLTNSQISTSSRAEFKYSLFPFLNNYFHLEHSSSFWSYTHFTFTNLWEEDSNTVCHQYLDKGFNSYWSRKWQSPTCTSSFCNGCLEEGNANICWECVNLSRCWSFFQLLGKLHKHTSSLCLSVISQVPAEMHWECKPRLTGWINKITTLEEPEEKKWNVSNSAKEAKGRGIRRQ